MWDCIEYAKGAKKVALEFQLEEQVIENKK